VTLRAIETVRSIERDEAPTLGHDDARKNLVRWAWKSESRAALGAMLDLARCQPGIPVAPDQLDADPWLLNCENGTLEDVRRCCTEVQTLVVVALESLRCVCR
jgi:putative DNA primase/helicase